MFRYLIFALVAAVGFTVPLFSQSEPDHKFDVRSSVGDLHIGDDADAKKIGVPLYPGARLKSDEENRDQANLSILTEAFGMKLLVANYTSNDAPAKVIDFYRDKLKKYGKVLECRSEKHGGDISVHDNAKESEGNKALKCDDNSGPVTELKVGTEENQHIVAVEPGDANHATKFALVYVHTRGKLGDI